MTIEPALCCKSICDISTMHLLLLATMILLLWMIRRRVSRMRLQMRMMTLLGMMRRRRMALIYSLHLT